MVDDATHIKTLERLLRAKQAELCTCKAHIVQYDGLGIRDPALQRLLDTTKRCEAETKAIEWALEKLTRSEQCKT